MIQQFVQEYLIESMVWFSDLLNKKKKIKSAGDAGDDEKDLLFPRACKKIRSSE